jgi:hypothetical protein
MSSVFFTRFISNTLNVHFLSFIGYVSFFCKIVEITNPENHHRHMIYNNI